jgi:hypothetical protein
LPPRRERLNADSKPKWGKFNAARMLAHLNDAMRMAIGELAWPEHPAFGHLTHRAGGVVEYRHADHHLRQFGV